MSRAGYSDDCDDEYSVGRINFWRANVARAISGRKGQAFLRELRDALDAMPDKRLVKEVLVDDETGNACALGIVALKRGLDTSRIDADDYDRIHVPFGISNAMAREIIYVNDESWPYPTSDEERWRKVRWWVESKIASPAQTKGEG